MSADCCSLHIPGVDENFPESNGLAQASVMSDGGQFRVTSRCSRLLLGALAVAFLWTVAAGSAFAQVRGVPPSVTSIQFHVPPFLPNATPSVTSLGPYGIGYRAGPISPPYGVYPNRRAYGHRYGQRASYGYNTGAWIAPYYIPVYDASYGPDTGGAPYLYSGPPAEQTVHIVVDLPATRRMVAEDDEEIPPHPITPKSNMASDAVDLRPLEPTVLVFRDGHQQEVSNYAIMGQTVYVFDQRTQKIALSDLDVAATIKLNDDRGIDFHLPSPTKS